MGRSDQFLYPFYGAKIKPVGDVALLGFTDNRLFQGDLYDQALGNWEINSNWELPKNYDTIICTRCAYFCDSPYYFMSRCYAHLNFGGYLYVDWGYGDHWRFESYKIGWLKNEEQEWHYHKDNKLWSGIWNDKFLEDDQYKLFCERVKKFGYDDVKKAILKETPYILWPESWLSCFEINYDLLALWEDQPQLYILMSCRKK